MGCGVTKVSQTSMSAPAKRASAAADLSGGNTHAVSPQVGEKTPPPRGTLQTPVEEDSSSRSSCLPLTRIPESTDPGRTGGDGVSGVTLPPLPHDSSTGERRSTELPTSQQQVVEKHFPTGTTAAEPPHETLPLTQHGSEANTTSEGKVTKEDGKTPGTAPTTLVLGNETGEGQHKSSSMIFANDGSSSTTRLSVSSACLVEQAGDSIEDPFRQVKTKSSTSKFDGPIPFFTASIFAPHIAHDMLELQRRLEGGYTDPSSGRRYLTPAERWEELKREEGSCNWTELRPGAPLPQEYLSGAGILWAHPSIEDGLPVPLPTDALEDEAQSKPRRVQHSEKFREQEIVYTQMLTRLFRVLPQWENQVTDADNLDLRALESCEILFRELFLQTYEISATESAHARLRLMVSQFYVSLRDTLVLLQDPKRFVSSFSRLDRLGSMFQAEVLSLQQQDEIYEGKTMMMGIPPTGPRILSSAHGSGASDSHPVSDSCSGSPTARECSSSKRSLQLLSTPHSRRSSMTWQRRESASASPKWIPSETHLKSLGSEDLPSSSPPSAVSSRRGSIQSLSARKAKDLITLAGSVEGFSSEPGEWTGGQFQIAVNLFRRRACRILRYIIGVLKNFVFIKLLRLSSKPTPVR